MRRKRGAYRIPVYKEKIIIPKTLTIKIVCFCTKQFHMIKRIQIGCLQTLKVHKKRDKSSGRFFSGWFWVLTRFVSFWRLQIYLTRFLRCFQVKTKWIENEFLEEKKQTTMFFLPLQLSNFENFKQHIVYFFAIECNKRHVVRPINSRKKAHVHGLVLAGSRAGTCFVGQALDLAYQAHNTCPHSFYFSFIFFVNY